MADITTSCTRYTSVVGDIKKVYYVVPNTAAGGDTIDMGIDTAGGAINTILSCGGTSLYPAGTGNNVLASGILQIGYSGVTGILTIPVALDGMNSVIIVEGV